MLEYTMRFIHCHKVDKDFYISEDYEIIEGVRTLMRCACPMTAGVGDKRAKCNGINEWGNPCSYNRVSMK